MIWASQLSCVTNDMAAKNMKHIQLINDGKVLLIYEINNDKYNIPGGGLEEEKTLEECCERLSSILPGSFSVLFSSPPY